MKSAKAEVNIPMKKLAWLTVLFLLVPAVLGEAAPESARLNPQTVDCTQCHTCLVPTKENPCLRPCPRVSNEAVPLEKVGPKIVILDELQEVEDLYVPVRFNHDTHAHMSTTVEGCQMCHHYNEGRLQPASCKECHPKDIVHENIAQPGLKGAYHRQCVGCHSKWDRNTDCVICHEKKSGGPLNGTAVTFSDKRHYAVIQTRDMIVYKTGYEENDQVPFNHKLHAEKYDRTCGDCHHQQGCEVCHDHSLAELRPMKDKDPDVMHELCFTCHKEDDCTQCHGRKVDESFSHIATGWPLKKHHEDLHCRDCHMQRGIFAKLDTDCSSCHPQGWKINEFDHAITGVALDEVHKEADCMDCHHGDAKVADGAIVITGSMFASRCDSCHDDNRTYNREKGFSG